MAINKEIKVGIFALVSGIMLYTGFHFLKGQDFFSSNRKYRVRYAVVEGLTISNPVVLNGFTVGRVSDIQLLQDQGNVLEVTIEVKKEIKLTDSCKAIISNTDLLGGKSIVLEILNAGNALDQLGYLSAGKEKGLKEVVAERAFPVIENLEKVLIGINGLLTDQNKKSISSMLSNLNETSLALKSVVAQNAGNIQSTMQNVKQLTGNLVETEKQLKPLLRKFNTLGDTLNSMRIAAAVANANQSLVQLNTLLSNVNAGKGSVGKLLHDDSLYIHLNRSSADLDRLLIDLRERPKRYVHFSLFGRKDK